MIGFKTLILIDNSDSISEVNFKLSKETAKYICKNLTAEDSVSVATICNETNYITDYVCGKEELANAIDSIEMVKGSLSMSDTLVPIINDWKEQDVAFRNIILFTDGVEETSVNHANEELYYLLSNSSYPVFIVQSVDSLETKPAKNLSAIATMSNGKIILTEFEGSDAASEKTMGKSILEEIELLRAKEIENEKAYNGLNADEILNKEIQKKETDKTEGFKKTNFNETDFNETEGMFIMSDKTDISTDEGKMKSDEMALEDERNTGENDDVIMNQNILLKSEEPTATISVSTSLFVIAAFLVIVFVAGIFIVRKILKDKRNLRNKSVRNSQDKDYDDFLCADEYDDTENFELDELCATRSLEDDCMKTRILTAGCYGHDIVLEDCNDPTKLFRASCDEHLIVGRSKSNCDLVIDYDDSVSGRHCELSVRGDEWYVRDLQSSNGTRVNQQKVFQELIIKTGDILQLGQLSLQVRV